MFGRPLSSIQRKASRLGLHKTKETIFIIDKMIINTVEYNSKKIGVITSGITYTYAKEALGDKASYQSPSMYNYHDL